MSIIQHCMLNKLEYHGIIMYISKIQVMLKYFINAKCNYKLHFLPLIYMTPLDQLVKGIHNPFTVYLRLCYFVNVVSLFIRNITQPCILLRLKVSIVTHLSLLQTVKRLCMCTDSCITHS